MPLPNDPTRNALLGKLGGGSPLPAPGPGAGGSLPPPGAPAPVQVPGAPVGVPDGEPINNPVAFHLAQAYKELVAGGPEDQENVAALEAFWMQIAQLNPESQGEAPPGQPLAAPVQGTPGLPG